MRNMTRRDLKRKAKDALSGHWLVCVFGLLVPAVIAGAVSYFGFSYLPLAFLTLLVLIVGGVLNFGVTNLFQQRMRGKEVKFVTAFSGFSRFFTASFAALSTFLLQTVWSAIGFVPGVLFCAAATQQEPALLIAAVGVLMCAAGAYLGVFKALQYSQTVYLLLDDPNLSVLDAIKQSKEIMAGRKVELLVLHLTFIPWYLTVTFTAGFSLLFILPYVFLTLAGYHDMLMAQEANEPVFSTTAHK